MVRGDEAVESGHGDGVQVLAVVWELLKVALIPDGQALHTRGKETQHRASVLKRADECNGVLGTGVRHGVIALSVRIVLAASTAERGVSHVKRHRQGRLGMHEEGSSSKK